jgi:hypothetical protein
VAHRGSRFGSGVLIIEDTFVPAPAPQTGGIGRGYDGRVNIIGFIISFGLFVLGIYVMGSAFAVTGYESLVFVGGILITTVGVFIPIHILKRINA